MDFTTTISKLLTGTPQSQYAAIAILIAMIAIILSIVFNENELTLGERFMLIGSVILFSIPSIVLGLFDLTCVAGKTTENSLCWWWGWVISFIIIIICVIVVFSSVSSMLTYNVATSKSIKPVVNEDESNKIAKNLVKDTPETVKPKVEMPSKSDMSMQHNIQGMQHENMPQSGIEGMSDMMNHENMMGGMMGGMMNGMEGMSDNMLYKEHFTESEHKNKNLDKKPVGNILEGFQGCEYQPV